VPTVTEQPPTAGIIYCEEARRLLEEFGETVQEVMRLHEHQFQETISGDPECNRFDLLIHMANEKKNAAKYAYMRHLETHGCSTYDDAPDSI
jgi:hypothetical protein